MSVPPKDSALLGVVVRGLHLLPPEVAHDVTVWALGRGLVAQLMPAPPPSLPALSTTFLGHVLAHPLGLAAGFDKNAEALPGLAHLGFGFLEVGTVTPRPQVGNPKPRLFRLRAERALINRMGFNNQGLAAIRARLEGRDRAWGMIGVNIGANRDSPRNPIADYVTGLEAVYEVADYVTINVSSPNTPGLRELQAPARLDRLLAALGARRELLADGRRPKPLLLKIAPDLARVDEMAIADVALARGVDGLIIANTTLARPAILQSRHRDQAGGLSGPPLFLASTAQLARFFRLTGGRLPLVGVGGISTGADAYAKIRAGASALQLYTGLIHQGPAVIGRILGEFDTLLARDGLSHHRDAIGIDADR